MQQTMMFLNKRWWKFGLAVWFFGLTSLGFAAIQVYEFDEPAAEEQFNVLIQELRCPKCQNQNVADSDAMIATDIKNRVYEWVLEGHSSEEITGFLVDRYGDFVTYRPPLRASTIILWAGPPLILVLALLVIILRVRQRASLIETENIPQAGQSEAVEELLDQLKSDEKNR